MNRTLILSALLAVSALQGPAAAQSLTAPAPTTLSAKPVSFATGTFRGPLSVLLAGVAKAAGYEVVYDLDVDKLESASRPLAYSFVKQPFSQVWPLLMDLHGLSYRVVQVGTQPVIRVSKAAPEAVQAPVATAVRAQATLEAGSEAGALKAALTEQFSGLTASVVGRSLVISGPEATVRAAEALARQLMAQQAASTASAARAQQTYEVRGEPRDASELLRDQFPQVKVTALQGGRQLVISGEERDVVAAIALLTRLDRPVAPQVATVVREVYAVKGSPQLARDLVTFQYPALSATVSGSQLLLSGSREDIAGALATLTRVDLKPDAPQAPVEQRIFTLAHASAEEMKAVIEGTLSREIDAKAPATVAPAQGDAVQAAVSGAAVVPVQPVPVQSVTVSAAPASALATIIADKRTNTLVVRGNAEQIRQVAELVATLDQKVPQVNVKVRIQEVSETAKRSLGLDWRVAVGGFTIGSSSTTGLTAAFDPTLTSLGFNIMPALSALENQGLTKRVYDGAVTMQSGQRSLGSATSSENASSTAAASIKSGGRMEINIPSTAGNIEKQIDYGVNLDFFNPQVSPDGTVTVRVRGQVTGEPVVPESGQLPTLLRFTNNEAHSTITLKSGQTVVLAGLTSQVEANTTSGTPFLSSLPVIGALFGKTTKTKEKAELMVVVTAEVER